MEHPVLKRVRDNIPKLCASRHLTYIQICDKAGVSYDKLRVFLKGEQDITFGKLCALADAIGVTVEGLLRRRPR